MQHYTAHHRPDCRSSHHVAGAGRLVDRYAEPGTEILGVHDPAPRAPGQRCSGFDLGGFEWHDSAGLDRPRYTVTVSVLQPSGHVQRQLIDAADLLVVAA